MSELSNDNIVESQELSLPVTREEPVANDSNDLFGEEDQSTSNQQDDFFSNIQQPDQPDQPIIETNEELETVHKSTDVELPQEIPLEQEQIPQQPQQQENVIDDLFGTSNNDDDFFSNHNQDGLNSAEIETEENVEVPLQPVFEQNQNSESEKATISIDKKDEDPVLESLTTESDILDNDHESTSEAPGISTELEVFEEEAVVEKVQSTAEDSLVDATQPSEPGPLSTEQINLVDEPEAGAPNTEESQTESKLDQLFTESNEGDFFENIAKDNVEQEVSNPSKTEADQKLEDLFAGADNENGEDLNFLQQPQHNVAEVNSEAAVATESINLDLFGEDDTDFLDELNSKKQQQQEEEVGPSSTTTTNPEDKLAALDLDDDLLLDDDFLEEGSVQPKVESSLPENKPVKHHHSYIPSGPSANQKSVYAPPQVSGVNKNDFIKNLEQSKKKHDAYDFPDTLLVNKSRPAARHAPSSNKYGPPSVSQTSIPSISSTSTLPPARDIKSSPLAPPAAAPPTGTSTSKVAKKSFFEDFPDDEEIPKPKRAGRAAAPVKAVNQIHSPQVLNQQVQQQQQQQQSQQNAPPGPPPSKANKQPPVNPYMPKSGTSPILQQQTPAVHKSGIAAPNVNVPHANNYAPPLNSFAFPPRQPNQKTNDYSPQLQSSPAPPPPPTSLQPFPLIGQSQSAPVYHNRQPSNSINTNVNKVPSINSPYVPNAGPYAPLTHQRSHSRASSLVGGKGKEVNPYAPALETVASGDINQIQQQQQQQQQHLSPATAVLPPARARGFSNAKSNIYKSAPKVVNPEQLVFRQYPIFSFSINSNCSFIIPNTGYNQGTSINIGPISNLLKDKDLYATFPGPLSKSKSKKKDVEKWLELSSGYLRSLGKNDELVLNDILLHLIKHDGDVKNREFLRSACLILNPNVNFDVNNLPTSGLAIGATNAHKLDNSGINTVFTLIQSGNLEKALEYCVSRGDWALALIISGPENFNKIAAEYARNTFPFAKTNNKVLHIMPIILKVLGGNVSSVIEDLTAVPNEGEYANLHWREIISTIAICGSLKATEFLIEFGKFLNQQGNFIGSEIAYIMAGLPFGHQNFMVLASGHNSMYTEVYEYALNLHKAMHFPHLLSLKLKHALTLADYGLINESQRYIDHINSSIKTLGNKSPFVTPNLLHEFQNLIMRITEVGSGDDQNNWFSGKISRVNLDKIWGQIDKFIVGGDELKNGNNNDGNGTGNGSGSVFNKFSPSVSRNASSVNLHNYAQPSMIRQPSHLPYQPQQQPQPQQQLLDQVHIERKPTTGFTPQPPPLVGHPSTTSVNKYSPSIKSSPRQVQQNKFEKYAPSNNSSHHNLSLVEERSAVTSADGPEYPHHQHQQSINASAVPVPLPPPTPPVSMPQHVSRSPRSHQLHQPPTLPPLHSHHVQQPSRDRSPLATRIYPYSNSVGGQISTTSVGSIPSQIPLGRQTHGKQPSISSVISGDSIAAVGLGEQENILPPSTGQAGKTVTSEVNRNEEGYGFGGHYHHDQPETITESPELRGLQQPQSSEAEISKDISNDVALDSAKIPEASQEPEEETDESGNVAAAPPPPPVAPVAPPRKTKSFRSNPYAPSTDIGATSNAPSAVGQTPGGKPSMRKSGSRTNRYGPPPGVDDKQPTIDVSPPSATNNTGNEDSISMFSYGGYQNESSPPLKQPSQFDQTVVASAPAPPPLQPQLAVPERVPTKNVANIDDSFDENSLAADTLTTYNNNMVNKPYGLSPMGPTVATNGPGSVTLTPLILNQGSANMKLSNLSTISVTGAGTGTGTGGAFDGFPIPGSPDETTRPNSIFGGHTRGLFSSRLSESQSVLYQQYAIADDTVGDYIPIMEEDDEEDEDEQVKQQKQKEKEAQEQELKRKQEQQQQQQQQKAAAKNNNNSGGGGGKFFSLFGGGGNNKKQDNDAKVYKAHLGQKNTFVYDEKLKRWIDKSKPLEEQLQANLPPPPPPSMKKKPNPVSTTTNSNNSSGPPPMVTPNPTPIPGGDLSTTATGGISTPIPASAPPSRMSKDSTKPTPSINRPKSSLATASGLDDLLSLTDNNPPPNGRSRGVGGGATPGGSRRNKPKRRGYVNVMEK